ncbi:MAG: acyl-CoA dehydrogenase [Myxococcales bacterium]|nr:acyl-CoA dehydrogenase [Myxococcales bacterium]
MKKRSPEGGSFLIDPTLSHQIFRPEDFDEELLAIGQTAENFVYKEVLPREREMESAEGKAAKLPIQLLRKAAELGLCMIEVPEKYDGLGLGVIASMLVNEKLGHEGAFSVTYGAHSGIGTLPIVFFGNHEQKQRYLPRLATTEIIGAYCLSEAGSGSDALGARTKAVLNEEGTHYVLNGAKMWITNGAWADTYIIFAKVDGDKFTGFIVDRDIAGVEPAAEEHKLGLRGSSTTAINLEDAHVPVENVLGEVGRGHKIAFHILNMGRFKLGVGTTGGMKRMIRVATDYAAERKQFNTPIINFGAIRAKLADMTTLTYVSESLCYRIGGYMEAAFEDVTADDPERENKLRAVIEEYAIESSIAKVFCSEALDTIIDECLQIHGGYGFVEDYAPEKFYRDARVNRIFEGTNEINRLLIPGMLLKRAMKGKLNLMGRMQELEKDLENKSFSFPDGTILEQTQHAVELTKNLALLAAHAATSKYMAALEKQQQVLLHIADGVIASYAADSVYCRVHEGVEQGEIDHGSPQVAAAALFAAESLDDTIRWCKNTILACYGPDERGPWLARYQKLAQDFDINRVALREKIANHTVEMGRFGLSNY